MTEPRSPNLNPVQTWRLPSRLASAERYPGAYGLKFHKPPGDQNLPVRLHHDPRNAAGQANARLEPVVQAAVQCGIEPIRSCAIGHIIRRQEAGLLNRRKSPRFDQTGSRLERRPGPDRHRASTAPDQPVLRSRCAGMPPARRSGHPARPQPDQHWNSKRHSPLHQSTPRTSGRGCRPGSNRVRLLSGTP